MHQHICVAFFRNHSQTWILWVLYTNDGNIAQILLKGCVETDAHARIKGINSGHPTDKIPQGVLKMGENYFWLAILITIIEWLINMIRKIESFCKIISLSITLSFSLSVNVDVTIVCLLLRAKFATQTY